MSQRFETLNNADNFDEEDNDDENNGVFEQKEREFDQSKRKRRLLFGGYSYKRAKKLVFSPFNKLYKRSYSLSSPSTSNTSANYNSTEKIQKKNHGSSISKRVVKKSGNYSSCCCLCLSKPKTTLETTLDDIDLDDPCISLDSMKVLIEHNDFYCKECDTHFAYD